MLIGVPKEIKNNEFRVGLTPESVREYVKIGKEVLIQSKAGEYAGFSDSDYLLAGATITNNAEDCWNCDLVIKVKEPLEEEYKYFSKGKILYTYLHLAANEKLTKALVESGMMCYGYETITDKDGNLPCLEPMSVVAGKLAAQKGAEALLAPTGRGVLMGGTPGTEPAIVTVIGGGSVGLNAAKVALGMGATVTILDVSQKKLREIDVMFEGRVKTLYSDEVNLLNCLKVSDLVIGAVLIPGAKAPKIIKEDHLKLMKKGSVIVDVAIDQGGCCEVSRPTTHSNPTYVVHGVVMYCVANMPSVVARTSTVALNKETLQTGLRICSNPLNGLGLKEGLQIKNGKLLIDLG